MLAGTLPWPARTLAEWTDAHLNLPPTPLRRQPGCEAIAPAVEAAIAHALAKEAARRTPSAAAFTAELRGERADGEPAPETVGAVSTVSIASVPVAPRSFEPYALPPRRGRRVLPWVLGVAAVGLGGGFALVSLALHHGAVAAHDTLARRGADAATAGAHPALPRPPPPLEDPVARASQRAQTAARSAVREGLGRARAQDLPAAIAALHRAREPAVLPAAEVDPLREAVDALGAAEARRLIHRGDCHGARALVERLRGCGAAAGAQGRLERSTCARR
jgi:hypothetical protein